MICDTVFLIDVARGDAGALQFLEQAEKGSEAIRVAAPAVAKFWEAVHRARHAPRDMERVRGIVTALPDAPLDTAAALRAGRLLAELARDGVVVDPLDALTVAVALAEDDALVTRNTRDWERVEGLRVRTY